jgi:hypothetical protein
MARLLARLVVLVRVQPLWRCREQTYRWTDTVLAIWRNALCQLIEHTDP